MFRETLNQSVFGAGWMFLAIVRAGLKQRFLRERIGGESAKIKEKEIPGRMEPQVGMIMEGKVTTITKFGAFVALEGRRSGLVHISEIANTFVNDVHDFLEEGQTVKVIVLSTENGKINLSIKKALPKEEQPARLAMRPAPSQPQPRPVRTFSRGPQETLPPSGDQSFEDKLKKFLSSSEGKMADLNRSKDGKRGRRRR